MGYLGADTVKVIREKLKKQFPDYTLSVTRDDHSGVNVNIMSGPVDLGGDIQINHYYPERIKNTDLRLMVEKILQTIHQVKTPEYRETGDYGNQPDFYIHLRVGKWDRSYVIKGKGE